MYEMSAEHAQEHPGVQHLAVLEEPGHRERAVLHVLSSGVPFRGGISRSARQ